ETRVVSPGLRRALVVRDRGCRWPGCGVAPSRCQAHHIDHWVDGGPTNLANCCLLCRRHHRELHEGEWEVEGDANGELLWTRCSYQPRHCRRPYNWVERDPDGQWPAPPGPAAVSSTAVGQEVGRPAGEPPAGVDAVAVAVAGGRVHAPPVRPG
ncbi:MAG: HNH endonuclease signature motif containing protein, partial [Candidatus Dormibacteria bacterium]